MKQATILIFITLFIGMDVFAGAGTFPQGDSVKLLRDKLKFKTGRTIESGAVDPTSVATPGDQGSLFTNDTGVYFKGDDGITTNWTLLTPYGLPIMAKGSLLTSDGVANGEFTACADDEILVYDSAETAGVKCEAKPVASIDTVCSMKLQPKSTPVIDTQEGICSSTLTRSSAGQFQLTITGDPSWTRISCVCTPERDGGIGYGTQAFLCNIFDNPGTSGGGVFPIDFVLYRLGATTLTLSDADDKLFFMCKGQ